MELGVIIAAGGIGRRMNATGSSKQLLELNGIPVVIRSIATFDYLEQVREIAVAIEPRDMQVLSKLIDQHKFTKISAVVPGGNERAFSVLNAFRSLDADIDTVVVHDGARPLFPAPLLSVGIDALYGVDSPDGVVFGMPVIDTVKQTEPGASFVACTLDRRFLWQAQTPQIFRREALEKAFDASEKELEQATDDSSLVEKSGGRVKMIKGSPENIKITQPLDLVAANEILERRRK